ncbi:hypothetical protein AK830_g8463 [Neonectria ditissima]|uniref:Uncharacterized protein n=1 Tax=Neonectria ditissima TaxID=78410 RepID=A0A0P7BC98_9HYPO|nr:hypothetical protein AK830_g8463 [Neonectria ditissima]
MPCFRGVDVSIFTHPGTKKLPEFPHSDAASVHVLPPTNRTSNLWESESVCSDIDSPRIQKVGPRVSVYIPSAPGSQFGVHYSVTRIPEPPCHLYFKIFLNGRNITSWGINPVVQASGSVTRALFEPDDRWHYKEDGVVHRREGIEARCLYFLPPSSSTSVADDGGLIEVQAFRSKGRKRRAPMLGQHRGQELYGIASPSGGLLESPEDAYYYDWLLIDPKEYPFVSFRFHYRSWTNLRQLSLVPASTTFSQSDTDDDRTKSRGGLCTSSGKDRIGTPNPTPVLSHGDLGREDEEDLIERLLGLLQLPAPGCPPSMDKKVTHGSLAHANPCPLPKVPDAMPGPRKSYESYTPSIAASLLPYIEEEGVETEEAEFGLATQMPIPSTSLLVGESLTFGPQEQLFELHGTTSSRSQSCSWPLGHNTSGSEQAAGVPRFQHSSFVTGALERRECRIHSTPTSETKLTLMQPIITTEINPRLGEGGWTNESPPKLGSREAVPPPTHKIEECSLHNVEGTIYITSNETSTTNSTLSDAAEQAPNHCRGRMGTSGEDQERGLADWI